MAVKSYLTARILPESPVLIVIKYSVKEGNLIQPETQPAGYGINNRTDK
jgi:hypothetical protein